MRSEAKFDPGQYVIVCEQDPESGRTLGYYGTIVRVLANSKIRNPESPNLWRYRVSVPYMQRELVAAGISLVSTGMFEDSVDVEPDWKIIFDRTPKIDNQTISGSYRLPCTGPTYFLFQKSDSDIVTYRLTMEMGEVRPESKLLYHVPQNAKLDSVYVRDSIRRLVGALNCNVTTD